MFLSLLQWQLGVVAPDAVLLVRTSCTVMARIYRFFSYVPVPTLSFFCPLAFHPFPIGTDIAVRNPIIGHVFPVADGIVNVGLI